MTNNIVTGIDIGGSHITVALIDLQAHSIVAGSVIRKHVNSKGSAQQIISEWTEAIKACKALHTMSSNKIGIAMPGPFDYDKGISLIQGLDKYEALFNLNVKELLAKALQTNPADIFLMNDASCFLKGEVFGGAARDRDNVIGITLGTGLGSATYKNNIIYDGDLYYTPYKNATAEDYLSTRWFVKRFEELSGTTVSNVKDIAMLASTNKTAAGVFTEFGQNLGEVLAAYIKKHRAETVVIGGNIINAWELFINQTMEELERSSLQTPLLKASLGEEAAILGAASLCLQTK